MANQNGSLILQALEEMESPATVVKIASHIANAAGVNPNGLRQSVKVTLDGGVRYGYVQKHNRKYYVAPLDVDENSEKIDAMESAGSTKNSDAEEMEDRNGRRRRRRGASASSRRAASSGRRRRRRRSRSGGR